MKQSIRIAGHPAASVEAWAHALTGRELLLDLGGLERFPMSLLGALASAKRRAAITGAAPEMVRALRIIGAGACLELAPGETPSTLPFACEVRPDGSLVVRLHPSAPTHPAMPGGAAQGWLEHLAPVRIVIDLSALGSVNSVVIAWALLVAHLCGGDQVCVQGVNRQILAQFQQLRLDRILSVAAPT